MLLGQFDNLYGHSFFAVVYWVGMSAPLAGLLLSKLIPREPQTGGGRDDFPQVNTSASKVLVYYLVAGPLGLFIFFGIKKSCIDIPFFAILIAGIALGWSIARESAD